VAGFAKRGKFSSKWISLVKLMEEVMDTLIELTEADLDQIVGGTGNAHVSITQLAIGVHNATNFAFVAQAVTASGAAQTVVANSFAN
jgi:hypothetical protein